MTDAEYREARVADLMFTINRATDFIKLVDAHAILAGRWWRAQPEWAALVKAIEERINEVGYA